jgi:LysR family transcriptional regulator, glycine cleavage system transcriptional activator
VVIPPNPSLTALRAFEASARHLSVTEAARELAVTQGAVSRHVAALERELGAKLFFRHHRALELTPKGELYFRALRDAFERIRGATASVFGAADTPTLRVKLPPTFAIRWIVPRLARLHGIDRTLDVQITTSHGTADFDREDIDVAIHSGRAPPPGVVAVRLMGETLTPVCAPDYPKRGRPLRKPSDLARHTLLCSLHRPADWPDWIAAACVAGVDGNGGLKFENSSLAYQAAIDRLGVAMAQTALVADDLAAGRLIAPFRLRVPTKGAYFLIYPARHRGLGKTQRFESWLRREADAAEK